MCDIGTAFGIISSVVGFISDSQDANAQADFNRRQEEANRLNAIRNARIQTDTEGTAQQERDARDVQDIAEVRRQALQAKATARVAAGEAGVAGISVDALQRKFAGEEARFVDATNTSAQFAREQGKRRVESFKSGAQNQINQSLRAPVKRPSFFGAALRIGGQAYKGFKANQDPQDTFTTRRFSRPAGPFDGFGGSFT